MNCPHWLLALTIPFSRSDRAHTCSQALVPGCPKDCSGRIAPLESLPRLPEDLGRSLGGRNTLPGTDPTVNAPQKILGRRAKAQGRLPRPSYRELRPPSRMGSDGLGAPPGTSVPRESPRSPEPPAWPVQGTNRWHAVSPPGPSACHLVLEAQRAFRSLPSPKGLRKRAPPADLSDLPHVCELLRPSLDPACCTGVTRQ
jgi:hypothetical protein